MLCTVGRALIGQKLWDELAPLVPAVPRSAKGGCPWLEHWTVFNDILLFVLYTGIARKTCRRNWATPRGSPGGV